MQWYKLLLLWTVSATYLTFQLLEAARTRYPKDVLGRDRDSRKAQITRRRVTKRRNKSEKPNIVLILTDDQDELLGSMNVMPKAKKLIADHGIHFNNSFVTTPMCCPSRSTILTGMFPHNHHVYTNNDNCSSLYWQKHHETRSFATYLSNSGYRTGYFGKYLNEYNGTYIPPGWREWVGLIRNSRFYNYTLNINGIKEKHGDNYYKDYLTDKIANDSVAFMKRSKQTLPNKPVLMVLSVPAPHGPEDSAPQYQHLFNNNMYHRTPSWNHAPNPDKQFLLQITGRMEPIMDKFTDVLQQKRLQTLQSVDDLIEKVHDELKMMGELDNTYIIFTSDHGYHLGQYGIIKGKALPYDFDVRVPLLMRGPGIRPKLKVSNVVGNVDLAPTILDMAGVDIPHHMDGRSWLPLVKATKDNMNIDANGFVTTRKPWRDTLLLERGKVSGKMAKQLHRKHRNDFLESFNFNNMVNVSKDLLQYARPKQRRILKECANTENHSPCKPNQKWECRQDEEGKWRISKCAANANQVQVPIATEPRFGSDEGMQSDTPAFDPLGSVDLSSYMNPSQPDIASSSPSKTCPCRVQGLSDGMNFQEKRIQRQFIRKYANKNFRPRFIRSKRSFGLDLSNSQGINLPEDGRFSGIDLFDRRCRRLPNNSISCDRQLYEDPDAWKDHKGRLDEMITEYRKMLGDLRTIRKHLKRAKPKESYFLEFDNNESGPGYLDRLEGGEDEPCDCDEDVTGGIGIGDLNSDIFENFDGIDIDPEDFDDADDSSEYHRRRNRKRKKGRGDAKKFRKWKRRQKKEKDCNRPDMKCFTHDNSHWQTEPKWDYGPFCFCTNSINNTYWCLRTVNSTHDFLYCEFINNFISYYDMLKDPFQLQNAIHELDYGVLQQLHEELVELRRCSGSRECTGVAGKRISKWRRRRRRHHSVPRHRMVQEPSENSR